MVKNQFFKQKVKYNNHLKASRIKVFLILIVLVTSISMISALNFDNVKTYDEINKKATITNVFGFGETLAEITLTKNTYSCGTNCYAEGIVDLKISGRLMDGLRFEDLKGSSKEINDYQVYIKDGTIDYYIDDYEYNCIGDSLCNKVLKKDKKKITENVWVEYNGNYLDKGTYEWKITGTKDSKETIDWIANWMGQDINEWAVWSGDTNMSFRFEDNLLDVNDNYNISNASAIGSYITGQVGTAIDVSLTNNMQVANKTASSSFSFNKDAFTYSFWFKPLETWNNTVGTTYLLKELGGAGSYSVIFAYDFQVDGTLQLTRQNGPTSSYSVNFTAGEWYHIAVGNNGTDNLLFINGTLVAKNTDATKTSVSGNLNIRESGKNFSIDELKLFEWGLTEAEVLDIYNTELSSSTITVELISPSNNYNTVNSSVDFSCYANSSNGVNNISLILNGDINYTIQNTTFGNLTLIKTVNGLSQGSYNWSCNATDSISTIASSERYFNISNSQFNSQTYVASTVEGAVNPFSINVSYNNLLWNVISGNLWYNNNSYSATKTGTGNNIIFTTNVAAPNVNTKTNVSFFWQVGLTNSTSTYYTNFTNYNQTVDLINMSIFGSPYTVPFLNFTMYDESTLEEINGSISLTFNYKQSDATITNSFSYSDTNNNLSKYSFAISPPDQTYTIDATLEYYATGYAHKFYNFAGVDFTNITTEIGLYLLNESSSTSFVVEVKDSSYQPLVGVEVYVQKYDVGTGMWFTSEIAETDSEGKTIQHFYTEDNLYRFKIYDDGVLLYTSPSKIIACPSTPCTVTIIISEAFINPLIPFQNLGSLDSTLTYSKATNIVTYTYSDTSGNFTQGRLYVIRSNPGEPNILFTCNETSSSSTAVLTCDLSAETNGTYIATGYITRGSTEKMVERNIFNKIRSIVTGIGVDGVLWSIFFLIGIIMLGVYRPSLGIIFGIVGVILLWSLQLMEITITALVALIGIAIILLLEVRKE